MRWHQTMSQHATSPTDAQPESTAMSRREETEIFETLATEAAGVERTQRLENDPEHDTDIEPSARPVCPFCGDVDCSRHATSVDIR